MKSAASAASAFPARKGECMVLLRVVIVTPIAGSIVEGSGLHEGSALVQRHGIVRARRRRLRLHTRALHIGPVARPESELRRLAVVPPFVRVAAAAVNDRC